MKAHSTWRFRRRATISPRWCASSDGDLLVVQDLVANQLKGITRIGRKDAGPKFDARMSAVYWKTEDRLLFRISVSPADGISLQTVAKPAASCASAPA